MSIGISTVDYDAIIMAAGSIELPVPTPDQAAYLDKIMAETGKYDHHAVVGGPKKETTP